MALTMIQVGCGGFGAAWCRDFLPPNLRDGRIESVAAVDVNPAALDNARQHLGLPAARCYTDVHRAFAENRADFATVVVPPDRHESVVDVALEHGCHILSEKPIAHTLEAACRIARKVRDAGVKMGVTMSHRFRQDITCFREAVRDSANGPLDYVVCRFTWDARKTDGTFRYTMDHPLLIDAAVHHLDLTADLTGAPCDTLYAQTWRPAWTEMAGHCQGLVAMQSANGVHALYEGADANRVGLSSWTKEYLRAECRDATLILSHGRIERFTQGGSVQEGTGQPVPLRDQPKWANAWLIEQFCDWVEGGEPMATRVDANLQSVALVFGAIESSRTGQPVKVQEFLGEAVRTA
ncbi:MAG: Gfo/Idh/MocA family oxidoreductase [Gemmatimonadota bacterium]